jgi:FdhD protein
MSTECTMRIARPGGGDELDRVAEEVAIAFEYNGISHAVMLASPADLEDFAVGFSLSEGIVDRIADLHDLSIATGDAGVTLSIAIAGRAFARLKERRRTLAGRTGCGLCGAESLAQVVRDIAPLRGGATFPLSALYEGTRRLPSLQPLQQRTGAAHAACRVLTDGSIDFVREDVGRHNALDKTLGALSRAGLAAEGGLIVTSRASLEMVQKAATLGYGLLAAVSAPTAAAVRLAEHLNLALVGFLRGERCAIYNAAERLPGAAP